MFRRVNVVLLASAAGNTSGSKVINHYARLGINLDVAATATPADLKSAYRRRALECHPDVAPTPEDKSAFEAQFRNLAESYDILCDPEARAQLNKDLLVGKKSKKKGTKAGGVGEGSAEPSSSFMSSWSSPTPSSRSRTATTSYNNKNGDVAPNEAYNAIREKLIRRRQEEIAIEKELFKRYTDAHHKKHKGFLRRDADRVFKSAFDGKTWDQVLFELEKERRSGASRATTKPPTPASSSSTPTSPSDERQPAAADHSFSRAATRAVANKLRSRIEKGGGATHGVHRIMMSQGPIARSAMSAATPGNSKHMPFRPFPMPLSQNAPLGLTADVVVPNLSEGPVDGAAVIGTVKPSVKTSRVVKDMDTEYSRSKRRELDRHNPHNLGQLYSYQRPY